MTNEIITLTTNALPAVQYTAEQAAQWHLSHVAISGVSGMAVLRWLTLEIPKQFANIQSYCDTHEGGWIEIVFHKLFGKPIVK